MKKWTKSWCALSLRFLAMAMAAVLLVVVLVLVVVFFCFNDGYRKVTPTPTPTPTTARYKRFQRSNSNTNQSRTLDLEVQLQEKDGYVVMENGIVKVTLSTPDGDVVGVSYNGIDNLLETKNQEKNRGYWDAVWNKLGKPISTDRLKGASFQVIVQTDDQLEIAFSRTWSPQIHVSELELELAPVNVDKRYILLRGSSGFYTYAIFERLTGWPEVEMDQVRVVYKLQSQKFQYMVVSDDKQRFMPTLDDRENGQPLAFPEAILLTNPADVDLRGEVDDKYQYSCEDKDNKVHGWICNDPPTGFWMITPSDEFRVAGPVKQDLTSHAGPITLSMFVSTHYAGKDVGMRFEEGEPWKKVFGPVLVYLNSVSNSIEEEEEEENPISSLWEDAKEQMTIEVDKWPYYFPQSEDFPSSQQRGTVSGQLLVSERYISEKPFAVGDAYVGLALPGIPGSWQRESKGYQFWTQTDDLGNFLIKNVRAGDYNLYAFVPGFIGDYKYEAIITIEPGSVIRLDVLVYNPPRQGPTLWEIGIPDRSAAEFYVPEPYPTLMNKLYNDHPESFRQYGLWERYADLYPDKDLVFTVGADDYSKDWFFAHVTRNVGNRTYQATSWTIIFPLETVNQAANYTFQVALASTTEAELQVRFNDIETKQAAFTTGQIGKDNAIARHGIHGLYWFYSINLPGNQLQEGNNSIYLTQPIHQSPFQGIMYDYIRLEGPSDP